MPIHKVKGGYKWGAHGHVYPSRKGAERQAEAAYAHGYRGDEAPNTNEFGKLKPLRQDSAEDKLAMCAGILFRDDGRYFLVQRGNTGLWEAPGGHIEPGETALECAIRETEEEIAIDAADLTLRKVDHSYHEGTVFTTYLAERPISKSEVKLTGEHIAWGWFPPNELPEDMHPETLRVIEELSEFPTELEVARCVAKGILSSPQRFGPVWLFALRVTGTGVSFRPDLNELVYRPPEYYLNDEFLERCNGLPCIFMHPDGKTLDSDEYRERSIGSCILPFILGESVWAIARIYDDDAAELMMTTHKSTSPAVQFANRKNSRYVSLESGERLLLEGEPVLLDHLAICEVGVWDKGESPSGILIGETIHERSR